MKKNITKLIVKTIVCLCCIGYFNVLYGLMFVSSNIWNLTTKIIVSKDNYIIILKPDQTLRKLELAKEIQLENSFNWAKDEIILDQIVINHNFLLITNFGRLMAINLKDFSIIEIDNLFDKIKIKEQCKLKQQNNINQQESLKRQKKTKNVEKFKNKFC